MVQFNSGFNAIIVAIIIRLTNAFIPFPFRSVWLSKNRLMGKEFYNDMIYGLSLQGWDSILVEAFIRLNNLVMTCFFSFCKGKGVSRARQTLEADDGMHLKG